jgi:hypothetical protein
LTGTTIAPMALAAIIVSRNSGRFVIMIATRSPALMPRCHSAAATPVTRSWICAQVIEVPSKRR